MITPPLFTATAEEFHRVNVEGIKHLCDLSAQNNVKTLVHMSSIAVTNHYVEHIEENEDHPLPDISSYKVAYDISKRKGEEVVVKESRFKTVAIRSSGILAS